MTPLVAKGEVASGLVANTPLLPSHSAAVLVCGCPFGSVYVGPMYFIGARHTAVGQTGIVFQIAEGRDPYACAVALDLADGFVIAVRVALTGVGPDGLSASSRTETRAYVGTAWVPE